MLGLCETRFNERHDAVNVFFELYEPIVHSLFALAECNRSISSRASGMFFAIEKSDFLVCLLICEKIFSYTLPLSKYVESPGVDLSSVYTCATSVIETLQLLTEDVDVEFHKLFESASKIYKLYFDTELKVPRLVLVGRQTNRENYPHGSDEEYFRRTIFVPSLDDLLAHLKSRFSNGQDEVHF